MRQLFATFTLRECREAIGLLEKRVDDLQVMQRLPELTNPDEGFLDRPLAEFDLRPVTKNQLGLNGINTVRDIAEAGFERLALLRRIGPGKVDEIKRWCSGKKWIAGMAIADRVSRIFIDSTSLVEPAHKSLLCLTLPSIEIVKICIY